MVPSAAALLLFQEKSGLPWLSPMPLDSGQRSAVFHLAGPIFVTDEFPSSFWGLGCWLTWRGPGCDSFATALSGSLVLARIVQLKLRHEPWPTGSRLTRQEYGAPCQRAKLAQRPFPCQSAQSADCVPFLLDMRPREAVCVGKGLLLP